MFLDFFTVTSETWQGSSASSSSLNDDSNNKIPKSLILRRGKTAAEVGQLVQDLRRLSLPYTALHFQEDAKNRKLTLQKYTQHLALPMGVTHIWSFSQTSKQRLQLRVARTPEGPTLSFRVHQFSLTKHIQKLQRRPVAFTTSLTANPPLVVTHNFGSNQDNVAPHVKLLRITFQNMFPATNVATVQLSDCRRVVLFHYLPQQEVTNDFIKDDDGYNDDGNIDPQKAIVDLVQVRHYAIQATPTGVNRRIRRLVVSDSKKLPNLNKCEDIADYLQGYVSDGGGSDSEAEADQVVTLPDRYVGRGNHKSQTSALKLVEIGPRLTLELQKVEKGLGAGAVLYHAYIQKTPEEAAALQRAADQAAALKIQRRKTQEQNVERKRKAAEEKRLAKKQRQEERQQAARDALRQGRVAEEAGDNDDQESE